MRLALEQLARTPQISGEVVDSAQAALRRLTAWYRPSIALRQAI